MNKPSDWRETLLQDLAHVQTGLSKSQNRKCRTVKRPYLRVANVQDGHLDLSELKEIDVPLSQVERFQIQKYDILLTEGGDFDKLGRGCLWKNEVPGCVHQNHIFAVRVLSGKEISPKYLAYQIQSPRAKTYFLSCAKRTTNLASINSSQIKSLPVLLPSPAEQKRIIEVLSVWDHAIDLTERLIAEKQLLRKGLMQQLLTGKRHLPGFNGEWREVHLGEIFLNRTETGRTDLPLVSITADRGVIYRDETERKDSSALDKSKYLRILPGDIGYNTMRMWQGVSGLSAIEGIVSPAYTIVAPKKGVDGNFIAVLFKSPPLIHLFYRYSQGLVSDTWNLKFHHFAEIEVTIPEKNEQKAIARIFQTVDRELEFLRKKVETLREQKKGLMQQLLTGKKRVAAESSADTRKTVKTR